LSLFACGESGDDCGDIDASTGDTDSASDTGGDSDTGSDPDTGSDSELCVDGVLDGDFYVTSSMDLDLMEGCVEITGTLGIVLCNDCEGLEVLQSLTQIGGSLQIFSTDPFTDLAEFGGLTAVGDELLIQGNELLESLDGLAALTEVGGLVDVSDNELLPYCEVCEFIDQLELSDTGLVTTDNLADECGYDAGLDCDGGFADAGWIDAGPDGG
jgi:hypothetical protein